MAMDTQQSVERYRLPEKFDKLSFFHNKESNSNSSNESTDETMSSVSLSPTSPPATTNEPYDIQPIKDEDHERALDHLRRFFFRDEPLNINIKLLDESNTCKELEDYSRKCMKTGYSFMAVSKSGHVVGVCVNDIDRRPKTSLTEETNEEEEEEEEENEEEQCGNEKFQKILNLLATVEKQVDIFSKYEEVESVMNCKLLSVDSGWRGRGIAKNLLDKTREVAKKEGHGLMRVDCTSHYSAKAIARLGFECIYSLKYCEHLENGKVVFDPEAPHTEVRVYVQKIVQ